MKTTFYENILFAADDRDLIRIRDKRTKKLICKGKWFEDWILSYYDCTVQYTITYTPQSKIYDVYI